jgi:hypothetical protein
VATRRGDWRKAWTWRGETDAKRDAITTLGVSPRRSRSPVTARRATAVYVRGVHVKSRCGDRAHAHDVDIPVAARSVKVDVETLLVTVVVLFTIAALGGIAMAAIRFGTGRNPPAWLAMVHGMLGAAGLTLLAFALFTTSLPSTAMFGGILILAAAVGGAVLNLGYHWHGRLLPSGLLIGHALLAVSGYVLLLLSM